MKTHHGVYQPPGHRQIDGGKQVWAKEGVTKEECAPLLPPAERSCPGKVTSPLYPTSRWASPREWTGAEVDALVKNVGG